VTNWFGVLAPAKTPKDIQDWLNQKLVATLRRPDVKKQLLNQGAIAAPTTQAEFSAFIESQTLKWGKLIKAAHIEIRQ
jgi:tripartite-type tricarboxylate transporter receptor subunit TctC